MKPYGITIVLIVLTFVTDIHAQCGRGRMLTFARWTGASPEEVAPVFMYAASGKEESLTGKTTSYYKLLQIPGNLQEKSIGACLARCRELPDCAGVAVAYSKGNCHGVADTTSLQLKVDNDVAYFKKICLELPEYCTSRWWSLEVTPGYNLHAESPRLKMVFNTTMDECYDSVFEPNGDLFRSAMWVGPESSEVDQIRTSDFFVGNCVLNAEDKFTEPESYRVSNYHTFYIENQCRHDYPNKIDRCSYEEYNNQTLKHVELTYKNYTKDECKTACEVEERFVCRGFSWVLGDRGIRGLCDLHSEDLVTTGSWLLRRTSAASYYRRVICLNISVDCEESDLVVTYRPRGVFRGRVYVPGRGERCSARATGGLVRLSLPLRGDCDVNFAYGISNGPNGVINRTMAYVMVMIQNNPIIQTAGDRWVRVGCSPGARAATQVDATVAVRDTGVGYRKPTMISESSNAVSPAAASAVYNANTAPLTMYVVRAEDDTGAGAVSLGEPLEIRIETTDGPEIEAYHLVASSRLGDSSVLLLDSKGCPTGQVDFPAFSRSWLSGTQRLSARFKAFRFPTSHVVRFALMVRFCDKNCTKTNCGGKYKGRITRGANETNWSDSVPAAIKQEPSFGRPRGVVAQGGTSGCGAGEGAVPLELEVLVDSKDILSTDTMVRADHRASEEVNYPDGTMVCVHELLLVSLALAWLAVQVLLLLGCCILVKRYRNLAEMSMQKDYQSFDNVGFDTVSTHRRVHWPDQHNDVLHT